MKKQPKVSTFQLRQLSVKAEADPRTVLAVLAGKTARGEQLHARIVKVLTAAGLLCAMLLVSCGVPKGESEMASTVSLVQMLAAGMTTSAGLPLASGRATFFLPGTLTPVSVYADSAAATPISPPLVLTAGGTGIAYTKVPTRMIVKDPTSTTTYFDGLVNIERAEQQYIQSTSINGGAETTMQAWLDAYSASFGGSAGLWKVKTSSAAVERNLIDLLLDNATTSVKSFGAAGDGIADDTAEILAAIAYVASLGGGTVYLPPGTYLTSSAITWSATGITLAGAGSAISIIKNTNATGNGITISGSSATVRNLAVSHSSASSGTAISGASVHFVDVVASGHVTGVASNGATMTDCVLGGTSGSGFAASSGSNTLVNTTVTSVSGAAVAMTSGSSLLMIGGLFVVGGTGLNLNSSGQVTLIGVRQAGAGTPSVTIGTSAGGVTQFGCQLGAGISDGRTGAPVAYSFAGVGNFTPDPLSTDTIRVIVTAAVTITVNSPGALGLTGQELTIIQINNSGGAVTWSYNAIFKLQGGAAAAPSTGNMISSTFKYDPISAKWREITRSAEIPI